MLNHKQKFWLKFQKEAVLEVDINSEEERKRKRKEENLEGADLIRQIEKKDSQAYNKVNRMLRYLQNSNLTTFDMKIIQGLFEEYKSDSDEEEKQNRALDTEEYKKEFYSLALEPHEEPRRRGFNAKLRAGDLFDLSSLRNLYEQQDGLISMGGGSATVKSISPSPLKKKAGIKHMKTTSVDPIISLQGNKHSSSAKLQKSKSRIKESNSGIVDDSVSKRFEKINEFAQEQEESDEDTSTKKKSKPKVLNDGDSITDYDYDNLFPPNKNLSRLNERSEVILLNLFGIESYKL